MKTIAKFSGLILLALFIGTGVLYLALSANPEFGGEIAGDRLKRAQQSPQYSSDHFVNLPDPVPYSIWVNIQDFLGDQIRIPPGSFPSRKPDFTHQPSNGLVTYWLGHATVLVELEGKRILTDPMLSDAAFPVDMIAPKRFNPSPVKLTDLPSIDIATISHDHYDHLDMKTIQHLSTQGTHFYVGLGVGAHLEKWGIPTEQIHEMDWWDQLEQDGLQIHCTPARHYSGRTSMDNSTLWTSWVIKGKTHTIFHSGDSGFADHFSEIGKRFGPIDVSYIKIGDYGKDLGWQDIHMTPDKSIQAHQDVNGNTLFPIHWGTFQLSNHDWDEPIKWATTVANKKGVTMVTPMLGQPFIYGETFKNDAWWETIDAE